MKRQIIFGTMLSAAFAVGLAAQEPQPTQPPTSQPPTAQQPAEPPRQTPAQPQPSSPVGTSGVDQNSSANQTVTLTGCVQAGNQLTGGAAAPGSAGGAAQSAQGYILTNVTTGGSGGSTPGTAGTSGSTAGRTSSSGTAGVYRLSGESSNLQQFVGQRVEITGTTASRASAGAGSTGSTAGATTPPAGSTPGAMAGERSGNMPTLRITSVKPASGGGSCTQ